MTRSFHPTSRLAAESSPKYGLPLTGSNWVGLPLREGHWAPDGNLDNLSSAHDTVLLWMGGTSQVTLVSKMSSDSPPVQHRFVRASAMLDLLPRGCALETIRWQGDGMSCVSVSFPEVCVRALTTAPNMGLNEAQGPSFCVVDSHVVDLMQRLQANASGHEDLGAVYIQSLSLALISYISARHGRTAKQTSERGGGFSASQRRQLVDFIEESLASNFGLVDLAALVAYSPDHFSRLFKRSFGSSPHKYVSLRRVERARAMLLDENLAIADIAVACGFSSQAHLGDVFKRQTGVTPGSFRKGRK